MHHFDLKKVKVTASHSEIEPWRLVRLHQTVGYLYALTEFRRCYLLFLRLAQLHDHKGELTVTWTARPTPLEYSLVNEAWQSAAGDGGGSLEHQVVGWV
jgi:hypothetical protein